MCLALTKNLLEIVLFKIQENGIPVLTELPYYQIILEPNMLFHNNLKFTEDLTMFNFSSDHLFVCNSKLML